MEINQNIRIGPQQSLSLFDAICIVLGITIGAGIFRTPGVVASHSINWQFMLGAWIIGGFFCICGALCYAELASNYPEAGGEYTYLSKLYGRPVSFLFAWGRMTVIQTGSIASMAYIFGDYAAEILPLGITSSTIYASCVVIILTLLNIIGLRVGKNVQNLLTIGLLIGISAIILVSLKFQPSTDFLQKGHPTNFSTFGLALVFVLYTYGGWNEAAYITAELRKSKRNNILLLLVVSTLLLIIIYLLINVAYLRILGFKGMQNSDTVASDAIGIILGKTGSISIAILVILATLSSINGCIFTGARSIYAMGTDYSGFHWLGKWHLRFSTPFNALLAQGLMSLILIIMAGIGGRFRRSFVTIVEYTAPVFWLFIFLIGIGMFVLRNNPRTIKSSFKVPVYPLFAIPFCVMSAYMLYSSLVYTKYGALVGVSVLLIGVPVYFILNRHNDRIKIDLECHELILKNN